MKKYLYIILFTLISLTFVPSCIEDPENEFVSMKGTLTVNLEIPEYVEPGDTFNLNISGITEPADVEYSWASPFLKDTLEQADYFLVIPDTTGHYTITGIAFKKGYYSSIVNCEFEVIVAEEGRSIKGLVFNPEGGAILDRRDGQIYKTTPIGNLEWFAENLNWQETGTSYIDLKALGSVYGRLYTWEEATLGEEGKGLGGGPQGICPEGWSIPTNEDWVDFATAHNNGIPLPFVDEWSRIGERATTDARFIDERFWPYSPDNMHENTLYWNALPGGNSTYKHTIFGGKDNYGFWWSSTKSKENMAYYRYIFFDTHTMPMNHGLIDDFGASVRCVRLLEK